MDDLEWVTNWASDWDRVLSITVSSVVFYLFVVLLVRVMGKRVTAQMNSFDWIITVAVGSLVASGILLRDVAVADAVTAIVVLALCQWAMTWMSMKSAHFSDIVKPVPRLLVHKGEYLESAMRAERVTKSEVNVALRAEGFTDVADANWVILETNGQLTVVPRQDVEFKQAELMDEVFSDVDKSAVSGQDETGG